MIILTSAQADAVRGQSSPGFALDPRPLADGTYALPEAVLTDVNHASKWAILAPLPKRQVLPNEWAS